MRKSTNLPEMLISDLKERPISVKTDSALNFISVSRNGSIVDTDSPLVGMYFYGYTSRIVFWRYETWLIDWGLSRYMDQKTSGNYGFFCNYDFGTYFSEPSS